MFLDNGTGTGNVTVSATSVAKTLDCTGYVGTLTMNAQLTVSGNVTLVSGMTLAGTNTLVVDATGTITSAALAIPWAVRLAPAATATITLADDWDIDGTLTLGSSANFTKTLVGQTIYAGGTVSTDTRGFRGVGTTTAIIMNGTGSLSSTVNTAAANLCPITINTAGTITLGTLYLGEGGLFYVAGTVTTGGAIVTSSLSTTCTLDLGSISLTSLTLNTTTVTTLNSNATVSGMLSLAGTLNGNTVYCGSLNSTSSSSGTTNIVMNGTGSWSSTAGAAVSLNLTINTSGTVTISGNVYYRTGTLTYTAGTVVTTSSTLNSSLSTTYNTSGMTWNNVTLTGGSQTFTLNSLFSISGTLNTTGITANLTFAGTHGFTAASWTHTTVATTITLAATKTYTISGGLVTLTGTAASRVSLVSSSAGSQAIFTVANLATTTQDIGYVNATDIDSSLGQTVWDYGGTLSNATNWNLLTNPKMRSFVSIQ